MSYINIFEDSSVIYAENPIDGAVCCLNTGGTEFKHSGESNLKLAILEYVMQLQIDNKTEELIEELKEIDNELSNDDMLRSSRASVKFKSLDYFLENLSSKTLKEIAGEIGLKKGCRKTILIEQISKIYHDGIADGEYVNKKKKHLLEKL